MVEKKAARWRQSNRDYNLQENMHQLHIFAAEVSSYFGIGGFEGAIQN